MKFIAFSSHTHKLHQSSPSTSKKINFTTNFWKQLTKQLSREARLRSIIISDWNNVGCFVLVTEQFNRDSGKEIRKGTTI